jgi:hypothetical protein
MVEWGPRRMNRKVNIVGGTEELTFLHCTIENRGGVGGGVNWRYDACHISKYIDDDDARPSYSFFSPSLSLLHSRQLSRFNSCVHHFRKNLFLVLYMYMYAFFQTAFDFFLIDLRFRKSIGAGFLSARPVLNYRLDC